MRYLRTNTATRLTVGPFIGVDGLTPQTTLTVTSEHLTLMADNNGTPTLALDANATASGGSNDMVHVSGDDAAFYDLELTASQLNYLGGAMLAVTNASAHAPVFHEFEILPSDKYDAIVLGTDRLDVNVTHAADVAWASGSIVAGAIAAATQTLLQGLVTAALRAPVSGTVQAVSALPSIEQAAYLVVQRELNSKVVGPVVTIYSPSNVQIAACQLDDADVPTSIRRTV